MAYADVDICNIALSRIGVDKTVINLDSEQSKEARCCRRLYPLARDLVIESAPWPQFVKVQALSQVASSDTADLMPGWGYQYAIPSDAASVLEVVPAGEITEAAGYYSNCACDGPWMPCRASRYAWRRGLGSGGNSATILSGLDDAWAVYVAKITNPSVFTPMMVSLIADALAIDLGPVMAADPKLVEACMRRFASAFINTTSRSYEQERQGPSADAPAISARG